tara:strand:+ start:1212 stop:1532 length:321 start_codon:yes stop_codon:yes gene_type:complete
MTLFHKDYADILDFYDIDYKNMTKKDVKLLAEDFLANKLCRCIKKVDPKRKNEKKAIKICRSSVLHKKGVDSNRFKCKKKARFISKKGTNKKIFKYKSKKNTRKRK